jgi:hypothetical protein
MMTNEYTPVDLSNNGYNIAYRKEDDVLIFWWSFEDEDVFETSDLTWETADEAISDARKHINTGEEVVS